LAACKAIMIKSLACNVRYFGQWRQKGQQSTRGGCDGWVGGRWSSMSRRGRALRDAPCAQPWSAPPLTS